MVLPILRAQENPSSPFLFGKLPFRPDFLRINATHPIAYEFDELLQHAISQFRTQEGWEARYDNAPAVDVCYTSRDQKWVFLGVIQPSRDLSGRRYPLVGGVAIPPQDLPAGLELVPIVCELYFKGLREYLTSVLDGTVEIQTSRQFLESEVAAWKSNGEDFPLAEQIVTQFMETQHPLVLEETLLKDDPDAGMLQSLLNIVFYRFFLRRFYSPSAIQIIELPLKPNPGEANLHACTWLSILSAISGKGRGCPGGFFITHAEACSRLLTAFGRLPEKTLLAALGGELPKDDRLDLWDEQKTWQANKHYAETAYAMERLLHDSTLRLTSLCIFLKELGQKMTETEEGN